MHRDPYLQHQRDRKIVARFFALLQSGMPHMQAYADTGAEFYLSEKRVRDIVRKERKREQ